MVIHIEPQASHELCCVQDIDTMFSLLEFEQESKEVDIEYYPALTS